MNSNKIVLIAAGVMVAILVAVFASAGLGGPGGGGGGGGVGPETDPTAETPQARSQEIFKGTKVLSSTPVEASTSTQSGAKVVKNTKSRGFGKVDIVADYDIDGKFINEQVQSSSSKDKCPSYQFQYEGKTGELWVVYVCDGHYYASPAYYGLEHGEMFIGEDDVFVTYDSNLNQFKELDPKASGIKYVKVRRIDAKTLDSLTEKKIGGLK